MKYYYVISLGNKNHKTKLNTNFVKTSSELNIREFTNLLCKE